jgi:membrane protease YdiL (CAAX protease family)
LALLKIQAGTIMASSPPIEVAAPPLYDRTPVAAWWHTIVFVIGMLAYGASQMHITSRMVGAHPRSRLSLYLSTIAFELVLLGYVWLLGLRPAGKRLRDVIGGKWMRPSDVLRDIGVALLFWMVVVTFLAIVNVTLGQDSVGLKAMRALLPQGALELAIWVTLSVTAGFCEELVFRGYLQRQIFALTGMAPAAVVGQAIVFGSVHLYQGVRGAIAITGYGALFGILAISRNSLRPGMMQHAGQDSFAGIVGSFLARHHYI